MKSYLLYVFISQTLKLAKLLSKFISRQKSEEKFGGDKFTAEERGPYFFDIFFIKLEFL
jgi:hypothetical protein